MSIAFIVNSGSSSIKWELIDVDTERRLRGGIVERIGEAGAAANHEHAMEGILAELGGEHPVVIGHRVVHGGSEFTSATIVTDEVEAAIERLSALAPLHNPANLAGIKAARAAFPGVPNVAVFDTAFHQSLQPAAYTYAIDATVAAEHHVRRYGFHGTSYNYVSRRAATMLGRPVEELKLIVFHLGNGASVTAIDGGRSVDTSMGMTPLEGLVMGTRSGDLDAGILFHLGRAGLTLPELDACSTAAVGCSASQATATCATCRRRLRRGMPRLASRSTSTTTACVTTSGRTWCSSGERMPSCSPRASGRTARQRVPPRSRASSGSASNSTRSPTTGTLATRGSSRPTVRRWRCS